MRTVVDISKINASQREVVQNLVYNVYILKQTAVVDLTKS